MVARAGPCTMQVSKAIPERLSDISVMQPSLNSPVEDTYLAFSLVDLQTRQSQALENGRAQI